MDKKELRKEILKKRDALSYEERMKKSSFIAKSVCSNVAFQEADIVLLYASFRTEVDTREVFSEAIRTKKTVYFPKVHGAEMEFYRVEKESDFEDGKWGIREPKLEVCKRYAPDSKNKVCVIMPGAVFDEVGNRIGYGGGYYDKYLQRFTSIQNRESEFVKASVSKIAIAFECQMVENGIIKQEEYDVKPDFIITEDRIILCK